MVIYIKDMVCVRCKMAVEAVLTALHIEYSSVSLGKAILTNNPSASEYTNIDQALRVYKLELMDDHSAILVEQIKTLIIGIIHPPNPDIRVKFSEFLSKSLGYDYTYLANTFSELEKGTIEKFYILEKVERVKELLVYEPLNLTEIAYQLNYSSVSHLCLQFKKVTGQTPSMFKKKCLDPAYSWRVCE